MPSKFLLQTETDIVFGSEGGDDVAWSTENIADGAGRMSDDYDNGAAPRTVDFTALFYTQAQATPTALRTCNLHAYTAGQASTAAHSTGPGGGTSDAAVSSEDELANSPPVGAIRARAASTDTEFSTEISLRMLARHFGFAFWNDFGAAITNDAAETKLILTPTPLEAQ